MLIITLIAVIVAYKLRFKRFSLYLWLVSGLICLFWEVYLFSTGSRNYNFPVILELPYHAFTEAGPGLIIMILFGYKIGLFDLSEYQDNYTEPLDQPELSNNSIIRDSKSRTIKTSTRKKLPGQPRREKSVKYTTEEIDDIDEE
jgi:hypothetical protein